MILSAGAISFPATMAVWKDLRWLPLESGLPNTPVRWVLLGEHLSNASLTAMLTDILYLLSFCPSASTGVLQIRGETWVEALACFREALERECETRIETFRALLPLTANLLAETRCVFTTRKINICQCQHIIVIQRHSSRDSEELARVREKPFPSQCPLFCNILPGEEILEVLKVYTDFCALVVGQIKILA